MTQRRPLLRAETEFHIDDAAGGDEVHGASPWSRMTASARSAHFPAVSIPGYDVLGELGHGGFSVVYRARQHSMQRDVAVKVLNAGFSTDQARRRFERECHALGRLSHHPNIVTVFNEAMTDDGRPCIVMELLPTTYRERLHAEGPLPANEVMSVGIRICGALQTAHDAGILHRDLKPGNLFVSAYGEPALGDFGISTADDDRTQTVLGALSVAYAAPEVVDDGTVSARSDVYSLAASLYQMVSGEPPFRGPELSATLRRILTEPPKSIVVSPAPAELDNVLRQALAKDPDDRPANALEFAELLRGVQGRAGFERTAIPRLIPAARTPGAARVEASYSVQAPPASPDEPTSIGLPLVLGREVRPPADATVERGHRQLPPPPPGPSRSRRKMAAAVMAACRRE